MVYQVFARKWRPNAFSEVAGQAATLQALINALKQQRLHHAYLFTGTRGVGKTTLARLFAKSLSCEAGIRPDPCGVCSACSAIEQGCFVDVLEIDAASRTKVEEMRDLLDKVMYAPVEGRFKVYIIDEVHMLSGHSFNALLKTLEEPPPHVKFLLATTDPQKLPATILSRCLQFHLKRLSVPTLVQHLQMILTQEQVPYEISALQLIAQAAEGSVRDALSLLEQVLSWGEGRVTAEAAQKMLGVAEISEILKLLQGVLAGNAAQIFSQVESMWLSGVDFFRVLTTLQTVLHQMAMAQVLPESLDDSISEREALLSFAEQMTPEDLQLYYQICLLGQRDLPQAPDARMGFEMVLLRMLTLVPVKILEPVTRVGQQLADISASPPPPTPVLRATLPERTTLAPKEMPRESLTASSHSRSWAQTVPHLKLRGFPKLVADHCELVHWNDQEMMLKLDPEQQALLHDRHIKQIQEALEAHLGQPCRVKIQVGGHPASESTPAALQARERQSAQKKASDDLLKDPHVQNLMDRFGAQLDCTPHDG